MAATPSTQIANITGGPLSLPPRYGGGTVAASASVTVADRSANVYLFLGGSATVLGNWSLTEVAASGGDIIPTPNAGGGGGGSPHNPATDGADSIFLDFNSSGSTVTNLGTLGAGGNFTVIGSSTLVDGTGTVAGPGVNVLQIPGGSLTGVIGATTYRPTSFSAAIGFYLEGRVTTAGKGGGYFGKLWDPTMYVSPFFSALGWQCNTPEANLDCIFQNSGGGIFPIYGTATAPATQFPGTPGNRSLCYLAVTSDAVSGKANIYYNGRWVTQTTLVGPISYNGNADGPWYIGSGSASPDSVSNAMTAFRFELASSIRTASYYAGVWKALNGWT